MPFEKFLHRYHKHQYKALKRGIQCICMQAYNSSAGCIRYVILSHSEAWSCRFYSIYLYNRRFIHTREWHIFEEAVLESTRKN